MTPEIAVIRGGSHPWTRQPGWDLMTIAAADSACLEVFIRRAYAKFWMPWWQHRGQAVLIKPSGSSVAWLAPSRSGTPKAHCLSIQVGDEVWTDFSGPITRHKVVEREERKPSQTGISLKVTPKVPKSSVMNDAGGREFGGTPWIDCAWFRRVELNPNPNSGDAAESATCS